MAGRVYEFSLKTFKILSFFIPYSLHRSRAFPTPCPPSIPTTIATTKSLPLPCSRKGASSLAGCASFVSCSHRPVLTFTTRQGLRSLSVSFNSAYSYPPIHSLPPSLYHSRRRIKCDEGHPCQACLSAGSPCTFEEPCKRSHPHKSKCVPIIMLISFGSSSHFTGEQPLWKTGCTILKLLSRRSLLQCLRPEATLASPHLGQCHRWTLPPVPSPRSSSRRILTLQVYHLPPSMFSLC